MEELKQQLKDTVSGMSYEEVQAAIAASDKAGVIEDPAVFAAYLLSL